MLIRALIVLLVVLNLGVAAWWITQPPAAPPPAVGMPAGVPRLQLMKEAAAAATPSPAVTPVAASLDPAAIAAAPAPAPAAAAEVDPTPAAPATAAVVPAPAPTLAPAQCFSLGPYADAPAATAAALRVGKLATRLRNEQRPGRSASAYTVSLPPAADRQAAQAIAQRIDAAGFDDFLVIGSGEQANGIALGRYGSREAAQRRQAALQAKGFAAQVQAVGEESVGQWWLEAEAAAGVSQAQLGRAAAAAQVRSLDCAALR